MFWHLLWVFSYRDTTSVVKPVRAKRNGEFMRECFFDNNASTKPLEPVQEAMIYAMNQGFGNASSAHRGGEAARRIISCAKANISQLIGCSLDKLFFTSGATEANNWVFRSILDHLGIEQIVTTGIEHSSVREIVRSAPFACGIATQLAVSNKGLINPSELKERLRNKKTLVSIHWVNSETGVIQDIELISAICREHSAVLHVDGSQAVGKLPIDFSCSKINFLTFAAHKFHGPQGIGAVCCSDRSLLHPVLFGGEQENGLRPGTENLPGIAGFGKAAELRLKNFHPIVKNLLFLRDEFERLVFESIEAVYINGSAENRVCNTSNLRFAGVDGQALVAQLDAEGIRCSQSSACTAQIPEPSYVLRGMGLSETEAYSSVRFSFSELNSFEEIRESVITLTKRVTALREYGSKMFDDYPRE